MFSTCRFERSDINALLDAAAAGAGQGPKALAGGGSLDAIAPLVSRLLEGPATHAAGTVYQVWEQTLPPCVLEFMVEGSPGLRQIFWTGDGRELSLVEGSRLLEVLAKPADGESLESQVLHELFAIEIAGISSDRSHAYGQRSATITTPPLSPFHASAELGKPGRYSSAILWRAVLAGMCSIPSLVVGQVL
jgi:hypothetical protein